MSTATGFDKIRSISEAAGIVEVLRSQGKRIVLCHGVFDLLHIGHIRHFSRARKMGDVLLVTVTPDRFVDKGPYRPAFNELHRAEAIAALDAVDYVAINEWDTAEETLRLVKPDVYVKGSEFCAPADDPTGKMSKEAQVAEETGARLACTEDIVFSSGNLLNNRFRRLPEGMSNFIHHFRRHHSPEAIFTVLQAMKDLKVLIVGDAILDDYQMTEILGRSSKDPILAARALSNQMHAGGALAVANHVAGLSDQVHLLTVIGSADGEDDTVRALLRPQITPHFIVGRNAATIIKRRFLDEDSLSKLFEVYIMNNGDPNAEQDAEILSGIQELVSCYDLVIAADFGHGAISKRSAEYLSREAPYLCVMTQLNAGNKGQCTIRRYPKADFACISDREVRLEMQDPHCDLNRSVQDIAESLDCSTFVMTRGEKGCVTWSPSDGIIEVPAFADNVVDRVGAGDAFLSVAALASYLGADVTVTAFLGNIAGALAVGTLGNSEFIDTIAVRKWTDALLK